MLIMHDPKAEFELVSVTPSTPIILTETFCKKKFQIGQNMYKFAHVWLGLEFEQKSSIQI